MEYCLSTVVQRYSYIGNCTEQEVRKKGNSDRLTKKERANCYGCCCYVRFDGQELTAVLVMTVV